MSSKPLWKTLTFINDVDTYRDLNSIFQCMTLVRKVLRLFVSFLDVKQRWSNQFGRKMITVLENKFKQWQKKWSCFKYNEQNGKCAWSSIFVWWFPPFMRLHQTALKQRREICEIFIREKQRAKKKSPEYFHLHLFPCSIKNSLKQSSTKFIAKWIIPTKFQTIKTPRCFVTEGLLLWSSRTHQTLVGFRQR